MNFVSSNSGLVERLATEVPRLVVLRVAGNDIDSATVRQCDRTAWVIGENEAE